MSRIFRLCLVIGIAFLLGLFTTMMLSFNYPNSVIGNLFKTRQQKISIAMLVGNPNGAKDKGYYEKNEWVFNITKSAIHDINRIVDQENPNNPFLYSQVYSSIHNVLTQYCHYDRLTTNTQPSLFFFLFQLPLLGGILIHWTKEDTDEAISNRINLIIDAGVRIFILGCYEKDTAEYMLNVFQDKNCSECNVISPCLLPPQKGDQIYL